MLVKDNKYIPEQDKDFFILLRAGLWQKTEEELSDNPDWGYIYQLSSEQTVLGIISDGIEVMKLGNFLPEEWHIRFISDSATIIKRNIEIENLQTRLCKILDDNSIKYLILKGQAVAEYYPKPRLRSSGDIDILLQAEDFDSAIALIEPIATDLMSSNREHNKFGFNVGDIPVEMHTNLFLLKNGLSVYLQKKQNDIFGKDVFPVEEFDGYKVKVPTFEFHLVFLYYHILRHLFTNGIGIRQFCDFALCISNEFNDFSIDEFKQYINKKRYAELWTQLVVFCIEFIGVNDKNDYILKHVSQKQISQVWYECKQSGNFGIKYHNHKGKSIITRTLSQLHILLFDFSRHWQLNKKEAIIVLYSKTIILINAAKIKWFKNMITKQ